MKYIKHLLEIFSILILTANFVYSADNPQNNTGNNNTENNRNNNAADINNNVSNNNESNSNNSAGDNNRIIQSSTPNSVIPRANENNEETQEDTRRIEEVKKTIIFLKTGIGSSNLIHNNSNGSFDAFRGDVSFIAGLSLTHFHNYLGFITDVVWQRVIAQDQENIVKLDYLCLNLYGVVNFEGLFFTGIGFYLGYLMKGFVNYSEKNELFNRIDTGILVVFGGIHEFKEIKNLKIYISLELKFGFTDILAEKFYFSSKTSMSVFSVLINLGIGIK